MDRSNVERLSNTWSNFDDNGKTLRKKLTNCVPIFIVPSLGDRYGYTDSLPNVISFIAEFNMDNPEDKMAFIE